MSDGGKGIIVSTSCLKRALPNTIKIISQNRSHQACFWEMNKIDIQEKVIKVIFLTNMKPRCALFSFPSTPDEMNSYLLLNEANNG